MKKLLVILSIVLVFVLFTGCGSTDVVSNKSIPEKKFDNAIILAGNHANSVKPNYDAVAEGLQNLALHYGDVTICVTDGAPYIADAIAIPEQKKGLSSSKKKTIAKSQAEQIVAFINSEECIAKTEEVDLLKSLELASRTIHSTGYAEELNAIYIFDTGISTCGVLDFTKINLNTVDVENIMKRLEEQEQIVDLSGATVYWYGLCDTVEPQKELSATQKANVKSIWENYLHKAGATVYFMSDISTDCFDVALPNVTSIVSGVTSIEWNDEKQINDVFPEAVVYSEETLGFNPGTAELVDKNKAKEELEKTVEYMQKNLEFQLLLVGSTAQWGNLETYCKPLALQRCQTVKEILVESGIDEARITQIGMGYDNPYYVNDQNEDGSLNERVAKDNRAIIMLDNNSDMAMSIHAGTWR